MSNGTTTAVCIVCNVMGAKTNGNYHEEKNGNAKYGRNANESSVKQEQRRRDEKEQRERARGRENEKRKHNHFVYVRGYMTRQISRQMNMGFGIRMKSVKLLTSIQSWQSQ